MEGKQSEMAEAALCSMIATTIIVAVSNHFPQLDVNAGEAHTALLAVNLACSYGCNTLHFHSLLFYLSIKP
jgi:hypothetical protein